MKKGWPRKRLADLILDIKDGGTPSRKVPEYFGGDVYWCVVKDIKPQIVDTAEKLTQDGLNNCSAKVWPVDSVIISLGATIGQVGITKVPAATKQGIAGIVPNKQVMTPEFLAYGLLDQKGYIQSLATGTTIKEIRPKRFAEIVQLPVPPLTEQQRIVGILDEAMEGIASAKAKAEQNLKNARALFDSYLHRVFTHPAEGWEVRPLGELCDVLDSQRKPITKRDRIAGYIPYYGATGIQDLVSGFIFDEPLVLVGEDGAKWGPGERTAFPVSGKCWVNNHAHVLRPNRRALLDYWLIYLLNSSDLAEFVSGLTVPKLNQGRLREIPVPLPPMSTQQQLVERAREVESLAERLAAIYQQKRSLLEALKESLLHQAFSGQL